MSDFVCVSLSGIVFLPLPLNMNLSIRAAALLRSARVAFYKRRLTAPFPEGVLGPDIHPAHNRPGVIFNLLFR